eukprot:jgi/Pico_ML_1/53292/g3864.t1
MAVHFLLMVNKQGQTRLAKYCEHGLTTDQKRALEGEIVRKCIRRADKKYKVVYRRYFGNVCELDIMHNLEKAHFILDEMLVNGYIVETNKANILQPLALLDNATS